MARLAVQFALGSALALLSQQYLPLAEAQESLRQVNGPGFQGLDDACPFQCSATGPDSGNWSTYHNLDQLSSCVEPMFHGFSLFDDVDDETSFHRIYACTLYASDWTETSPNKTADKPIIGKLNGTFQVGLSAVPAPSDGGAEGDDASGSVSVLADEMQNFMVNGYSTANQTTMLFARFGNVTAGLYVGQGFDVATTSFNGIGLVQNILYELTDDLDSMTVQFCDKDSDADHIFGFVTASNASFHTIQQSMQTWSNSSCLQLSKPTSYNADLNITAPLLSGVKTSTGSAMDAAGFNESSSYPGNNRSHIANGFAAANQCRTVQVKMGDTCGSLAKDKCHISGADFTKYNSKSGLCSSLKEGQHVCCSSGSLPDYRPKPNADGSCHTTVVHEGQSCSSVAVANGLEVQDIEKFNRKTWGWNGCGNVWKGTVICVSTGTPPMPAPMANAVCGPQVPGTKEPKDKSNLASLNPCPLNACCDVWGQCGTTIEFCHDTNTGAPGTARPGTNGCISNCGTNMVRGSAPATFRKIGYYEGYNFNRKCLFQDAHQVDTSKYTHLHFGFGTITPDYKVTFQDGSTKFAFDRFVSVKGVSRILSFGGWEFSTGPDTYQIFRNGVRPENRLTLATNIAKFIHDNNLDGVDIDWEYPSAPDIPGIPPGDKTEGDNYLAFLVVLKNALQGKSLSIAAPASFWYLKGFPIERISKVVDYIIYMTYDLHGQWDAGNKWSQIGCPSGNCLRSHVNLTETLNSLVMITKAGVPSNKIVAGVTSYGRSFDMVDGGCSGPDCGYTGTRLKSNAKKGRCTDTSGYISNAEIFEILKDKSRVNQHFLDNHSQTQIVVYDKNQWVAYMDEDIRKARTALYQSFNLGGTSNWAVDLETFFDAPVGKEWGIFIEQVLNGEDPYLGISGRHGTWSNKTCEDRDAQALIPITKQWELLDADTAWKDLMTDWKKFGRPIEDTAAGKDFPSFIAHNIHGIDPSGCSDVNDDNCLFTSCAELSTSQVSGIPASVLIWNSLATIREVFRAYYLMLNEAATDISLAIDHLADTFAPQPPPNDTKFLDVMLGIIGIGLPMGLGNVAKGAIESGVKFAVSAGRAKEIASTLTSGALGIASALKPGAKIGEWKAETKDSFVNSVGQTIVAWRAIIKQSTAQLFDGSDKSIDDLGKIVSQGSFLTINKKNQLRKYNETAYNPVSQALFGFTIPAIWKASGHKPFIIDTGKGCHEKVDHFRVINTCWKDRIYQLVSPDGLSRRCVTGCSGKGGFPIAQAFSPLSGAKVLDGKNNTWNVTLTEIVGGSVETYVRNGRKNKEVKVDYSDPDNLWDLAGNRVTAPGAMNLPVCSESLAHKNWANSDKHPKQRDEQFFPCNI